MFGLSKEQTSFSLWGKCPLCGNWPTIPNYYKAGGEHVFSALALLSGPGTVAECPKCRQRWPVFASGPVASVVPKYDTRITETTRREESLGEDLRTIDNSRSSAGSTRRITVTKEWSQTYSIEYEKANTRKLDAGIEFPCGASLKAEAESRVMEHYALSKEAKQVYTEEISLDVPPKTKLVLKIQWKRIWQLGVLTVTEQGGPTVEVPFEAAVGVTFDQVQTDGD
jgi:hypothetical protein